MGRDGTESTTAKTATMDVDTKLNHVEGGDALTLVFGVWQSRVRQVERCIELLRGHRRIGRIYNDVASPKTLNQTLGVHHVRLFFDMAEVLSL